MTAQEMINRLIQNKVSKWKIKTELNLSWHTVRMWQRGMFEPNEKNMANLVNLYEKLIQPSL